MGIRILFFGFGGVIFVVSGFFRKRFGVGRSSVVEFGVEGDFFSTFKWVVSLRGYGLFGSG